MMMKITGGTRMTTAKTMEKNKTKMNMGKATTGGKKTTMARMMKKITGGMRMTTAKTMEKNKTKMNTVKEKTGGKTNTATMARMTRDKTMEKTQQTTGGTEL